MPWDVGVMRGMGLPAGPRVEWQIDQGLAVTGHQGFLAFTGNHVALRLEGGVLDIQGSDLFIDSMEKGVLRLGGGIASVVYRSNEARYG